MQLDKAAVLKIAELSRLQIKSEDEAGVLKDLSTILTWVEKLKEVDTEGIEPLVHLGEELNVLREDEAKPPLSHATAMALAPVKNSDYYLVPKVLDNQE